MANWIGKLIGKVRIENLVARGGMAEVYQGMHTTLERPVAVKVMLSYLEDQPELKSRFEREARVLASLRHPNIIQIYDFDIEDGQPYIVMEFVRGSSLADHLSTIHRNGGRLSLPEIGHILATLASAIDYAHSQGVVHRDIKPGNVLLLAAPDQGLMEMELVLTDFGLLHLNDSTSMSVSGTIAGTPAYMSPEQARGERVDHRTDIYALGIMLYEMLAGNVPFQADTTMGVLMKHVQQAPPLIESIPASLQIVLDKALAKDCDTRYQSAQALLQDFLSAANLTINDVIFNRMASTQGISSVSKSIPTLNNRDTLPPTPVSARQETVARPAKRKSPTGWIIGAVIGLFLAAAVIGYGMLPQANLASPKTETPSAAETHTEQPEMVMTENASAFNSTDTFGIARFYDVAGYLDEVILTTENLPPAPEGFQYEVWLVGNEARRSIGTITPGSSELTFLDDQGRNLLERYDQMEITQEPNPDISPNPSPDVVFSSGIPAESLMHIRHLFVSFNQAPSQRGLLIGLVEDATIIDEHARAMLDSYQAGDAAGVQKHAEAINNLLVGAQGKDYGDIDGDGSIIDPGDGYGLLLNGENVGYIEGTISHTQYAIQASNASPNIIMHGQHTIDSVHNVEGWAAELSALLPQIIQSPLDADTNTLIRQAAALADRMLHGRDLNGNERIEPIPGEGGVQTALEHAGYMIDMPILQGAGRMPLPAEPASESTPGNPLTPEPTIPGYAP